MRTKFHSLSKGGRIVLALGVAGVAFALATAVEAAIPDGQAVVHSCYNRSLAHGSPIGAMRAIDTDKVGGVCASWEGAVDLATPQYVQNVVTSTINETSYVHKFSGTLAPGYWYANLNCAPGYVATDPSVAASDLSNDTWNLETNAMENRGEVLNGTPNNQANYFFTLWNSTTNVTAHITCVNGRVFGQPGPTAPIKQAASQGGISFEPAK
jgi:hypothetical protein